MPLLLQHKHNNNALWARLTLAEEALYTLYLQVAQACIGPRHRLYIDRDSDGCNYPRFCIPRSLQFSAQESK